MSYVISGALGALTLGGVAWWAYDLIKSRSEEESEEYAPEEVGEASQEDAINHGTGPMAEQQLASRIANAQHSVFVAGAITRTVYTLLRDYMPHGMRLEVLANPKLGGRVQLFELRTKLSARIKQTEEITGASWAFFNIDGEYTIMLRIKNNAVLMSRDRDAARRLIATNRNQWVNAKDYQI